MPVIPAVRDLISNVMADNAWAGQRCFIIGGGASLKDFDFIKIENELVIGVNRAYERLASTIMFAIDSKYYKWIEKGELGADAKKKFDEFKGHKVWLDSAQYQYAGVKCLTGLNGPGLSSSMKVGLKHGGNSGYGALNLAVCLGANPIYLLGFDMKGIDGKQAHWHSGYPKTQPDKVYAKFKKYFESVALILKERGIKVINLNRDSALKCFEFGDFKDLEDSLIKYKYMERFDSTKVIPYSRDSLVFQGCIGFGDNFYQRQIIKSLAKTYKTVYVITALPELYWDLPNVRFIHSNKMSLRTQQKHMKSLPAGTWSLSPEKADTVRWNQLGLPSERKIQTKYVELENSKDFDFTFPVKKAWVDAAREVIEKLPLNGKKLCIVRRPTNRKEWPCPSRNPKIEYYQLLIDKYKDEYFFLGLADILKGHEWFDGEIHGIDKEFNKGEIPVTTIFGLMKIADMTITYPSFFMIAAIAIRATCFCIFGGVAAPHAHLRKNLGLQNFAYIAAEPFCDCRIMNHNCKKDIPIDRVLTAFEKLKTRPKYIKSVSVGVPPGMGDSYWVMAKMESFKERNAIDELKIVVRRTSEYYYTSEYLKLIPFVDEVVTREKTFQIHLLYDKVAPHTMLKNTQGVDYLIDPGVLMWLRGVNLEDILPEYDTNFHFPIELPEADKAFAIHIKEQNNGKLVLFYTSSIGNNKNWNRDAWKVENWMSLADLIFRSSGIRPIQIGAKWDRDYTEALARLDKHNVLQDYVGKTSITQTLGLIREATLVVGFSCGLPMMATYVGVPTVIFWPLNSVSEGGRFDPPFRYTWVPPETRNSGRYIPVAYGTSEATPTWIFNKVKEFLGKRKDI